MSSESVTLVTGEEELLVERAIGDIVAAARALEPDVEVIDMAATALVPGGLAELTSPSLFGGGRVVVLRSAQDFGKNLIAEVTGYAADPAPDISLVVVHAGGVKGKALLDGLAKAGARKVSCPKITKTGDRVGFVRSEVRRAGGTIGDDAARGLLDAVGTDLRELAGVCHQIVADTGGRVSDEAVARYHRGRAEVSGFTVADRTMEGKATEALEQLRWALATGVPPVLLTSALAQGVRSLAKVGDVPRGVNGAGPAKELGMPPWKVDRVRRQLPGWTSEGIARALSVVAETDAQVKGAGADPAYVLERAVQRIIAARASRG